MKVLKFLADIAMILILIKIALWIIFNIGSIIIVLWGLVLLVVVAIIVLSPLLLVWLILGGIG